MKGRPSGHPVREVRNMTKDSQPDNRRARKAKSHGSAPLTQENQNQSRNAKKQSGPSGQS